MQSKDKRECGVLLHITSLPSAYGIGSLGTQSYRFIDFLALSGQKYWQILPLVPIGEGNSPYKSTSCFAGEPLLIDLELLVQSGLLTADELPRKINNDRVDYNLVRHIKQPLLTLAANRFDTKNNLYRNFVKRNSWWLDDYALFAAYCAQNNSECLSDMDEAMRYRFPDALQEFKETHPMAIQVHKILQFLFYDQYSAMHRYAAKRGIKIIGDIPFYVSLDSADVWTNPDEFRLGRNLVPVRVAGVPPDIFSSSGQLWGNPVYDWEHQKKTGYSWWRKRLKYCAELYDVLRIDHFRAFESFYSIPYGAKDAKIGIWEKGPNMAFWKSVANEIKGLQIVAEDLGGEEPEVEKLVLNTGFPNMKVLQFGFDKDLQNKFLPRNYPRNCVCYTGTHDNDTALGWWNNATANERLLFERIAPERDWSIPYRMIAMALQSKARLVIIPMQDWLELDSDCRMNTPGTAEGNWEWRMRADALNDDLSQAMLNICKCRTKSKFL